MNIYQKIVKNFSLRYGSTMLCKILNFLFIIYLTNKLGDGTAGHYFWIIATTNMIALIVDAGFATILTRECSKDRDNAPKILFNMIVLKLVAAILMMLVLHLLLKLMSSFSNLPYTQFSFSIYIFGLFWITNSFIELFCGVFIAFERMDYDALINIVHRGLSFILGVILIAFGCNILGVAIAYFAAALVSTIYALKLINRNIFRITFNFDLKKSYYLLLQSLPLAFALLFSSIYFKVDTFMLGLYRIPEEVGWYGAVYRILEITIIIPQAFTIVLFPIFSRLYVDSIGKLQETYKRIVKIMFVASLPVALIITSLAKPILTLFGEDFIMGTPILKILIWAVCLIFVNFILLTLLTSIGLQKINALSNGLCVLINIALNLIFIPLWGGIGAAITTIITECCVFGICYRYVSVNLGKLDIHACFIKPIVGLFFGGLIIYFFRGNLFIGITLSFVLYLIILLVSDAINKEDIAVLKHLFESKKN